MTSGATWPHAWLASSNDADNCASHGAGPHPFSVWRSPTFGLSVRAVNPVAFELGRSEGDRLAVSPRGRLHPEASDYWDGNWVDADVTIRAGAFRGAFEAQFRTNEFERFRDGLRTLHEELIGRATFDPIEPWLRIDIVGDGRGHLHADCQACDSPGIGNRLHFALDFDQTDLPPLPRELDVVCRAFPVVGARPHDTSR